jgi:hypothetical protein
MSVMFKVFSNRHKGAAINPYIRLSEGSALAGQYPNTSLPETDPLISVAPNPPGVFTGAPRQGNEQLGGEWDLPIQRTEETFGQNVPQYPLHPVLPPDALPPNLHPPLLYPDLAEPIEGTVGHLDNSGRQHTGQDDGNNRNESGDYSWP